MQVGSNVYGGIHQDRFVDLIIHVKFVNGKVCFFFIIVFKKSFCYSKFANGINCYS